MWNYQRVVRYITKKKHSEIGLLCTHQRLRFLTELGHQPSRDDAGFLPSGDLLGLAPLEIRDFEIEKPMVRTPNLVPFASLLISSYILYHS